MAENTILNDEVIDCRASSYYMGRHVQERQLSELGFELLECLDLERRPVQAGRGGPVLSYTALSASVKTGDTEATMATRVGIDPIGVDEVQDALATHGGRYLDRVFRDEERRECGLDAQRLAARFAAKEATMKTLDRGNEAIVWRSIGVRRAVSDRPVLELTGPAAGLRDAMGSRSARFSSHTRARRRRRWYCRRRGTMTDSVNTQIRRVLSVHARLPVDVDSLTAQTDHS